MLAFAFFCDLLKKILPSPNATIGAAFVMEDSSK